MSFTKLPPVKKDKTISLQYFPDNFYAAVFRLWETVRADRIAYALGVSAETVEKAAYAMGLPCQKFNPEWKNRGYITTIRNAWHILPYEQLLPLLGWTEEKLALVLKEDDFLSTKLGGFKPFCEIVRPEKITKEKEFKIEGIKTIVQKYFSNIFDGATPFDFFEEAPTLSDGVSSKGLRLIYSYCGLYAGMLDNDISISYPQKLLKMYKENGINSIWLPVVLYQLVPFPFDNSYSEGWQMRQKRLAELVETAGEYGIKVYLYLNEPRCMPIEFFEKNSGLKGSCSGAFASLCTSKPEVINYLNDAVTAVCEAVPSLGGFFTITCSENLTHCKSKIGVGECPNCKDTPIWQIIADVLCTISKASRKVNPDIRTIAWTWAWDDYMTRDEITKCIDLLPPEIIIQCNSEAQKEFNIGGVKGNIADYSMSIPGPAPLSEYIWEYARSKGHEISAKVQVNVTWECSTLPFLPVFDLIREHMNNLGKCDVDHLMLSWTLGGYPSFNLKLASACISDSGEANYDKLLRDEFGEYAPSVKKAATLFSNAFRNFPFHLNSLYYGPQNAGPSNLLYSEPSGFKATMTGYAYDDIETWRAIYPLDVYINQLKKLSEEWKCGLDLIADMPDSMFKLCAYGAYAIFRSSYIQAEFIHKRQTKEKDYLLQLIDEEEELTLMLYELMSKSALVGYEAANHYYFNKGMLAEKIINCEYIKSIIIF